MFYNILDLAGIKTVILYKEVTGQAISHRDFTQQFAEELNKSFKAANAAGDHSDAVISLKMKLNRNMKREINTK